MNRRKKRCSKCGGKGPFYRDPRAADGLRSSCAYCHRIAGKRYRAAEEVRQRHLLRMKLYNASPAGKASQRRYCATERGKQVQREGRYRYLATEYGKAATKTRKRSYCISKRGKTTYAAARKRYRSTAKGRERHNVQSKLQRAVARGLVTRSTSCSVNDKNCAGVIHGHHEDYSKPFEVIWLCRFHHKERHRKKD